MNVATDILQAMNHFNDALETKPAKFFDAFLLCKVRTELALDAMPMTDQEVIDAFFFEEDADSTVEQERYDLIRRLAIAFEFIFRRAYPDVDLSDSKYQRLKSAEVSVLKSFVGEKTFSIKMSRLLNAILSGHLHTFTRPLTFEETLRDRETPTVPYHHAVVPSEEVASAYQALMVKQFQPFAKLTDAAAFQIEWMHVFPYENTSSFVGRLITDALLIEDHLPPLLTFATDRPRYYASLNGTPQDLLPVIQRAIIATSELAKLTDKPM